MSVPKRHHYVPQMILNGFTDSDGWLHWCRLRERPEWSTLFQFLPRLEQYATFEFRQSDNRVQR